MNQKSAARYSAPMLPVLCNTAASWHWENAVSSGEIASAATHRRSLTDEISCPRSIIRTREREALYFSLSIIAPHKAEAGWNRGCQASSLSSERRPARAEKHSYPRQAERYGYYSPPIPSALQPGPPWAPGWRRTNYRACAHSAAQIPSASRYFGAQRFWPRRAHALRQNANDKIRSRGSHVLCPFGLRAIRFDKGRSIQLDREIHARGYVQGAQIKQDPITGSARNDGRLDSIDTRAPRFDAGAFRPEPQGHAHAASPPEHRRSSR